MWEVIKLIFGLLLFGVILGDLFIAAVVIVNLWRNRWRSRLFLYFANLFLCVVLAIIAVFIANNQLPRPQPVAYRIWLTVALGLAGLGIWPAALKLLLVTQKVRPVAKEEDSGGPNADA